MRHIGLAALVAAPLLALSGGQAEPPTYDQLDRLIQAVGAAGVRGRSPVAVQAPADGVTVTTNAEDGAVLPGSISLVGARTARPGTVPHVGPGGRIEWAPDAVNGAIVVSGSAGDDTTSAVCTNRLVFVSDPESNVRFTVSDLGGGAVEVRVGVFYK